MLGLNYISSALDQGIAGGASDAALVLLVAQHLDEALVAPGGAPRVLHQPVILAGLVGAEANDQHTVIQILGITLRLVVDALRVELERLVGGIDGDGNGTNGGHSLGHLLLITLGNIGESTIGGSDCALVKVARVIDGLVGIGLLGIDASIILNIAEGIVHETAVASIVAVLGGAIDQILLGQRDEDTGLAEMLTLEGACAGEGPAAAAVSLILDGGHSSLGAPVHRFGQRHMSRRDEGDSLEAFIGGTESECKVEYVHIIILNDPNIPQLLVQSVVEAVHQLTEFVVQQIGVLIDRQFEAHLALGESLVVLGNLVLVLIEDLEAETLLGFILIVLAVLQLHNEKY